MNNMKKFKVLLLTVVATIGCSNSLNTEQVRGRGLSGEYVLGGIEVTANVSASRYKVTVYEYQASNGNIYIIASNQSGGIAITKMD